MSRRKQEKLLEQVNVLDLAPVRRANWVEKNGRVVIERPKPLRKTPATLFEWLGYHMSMRLIRLDEVGSETWRLLDGHRTVGDVAGSLRRKFGEAVEPAEERVGRLVQLLHRQDFVSYPGWDDTGPAAPL